MIEKVCLGLTILAACCSYYLMRKTEQNYEKLHKQLEKENERDMEAAMARTAKTLKDLEP